MMNKEKSKKIPQRQERVVLIDGRNLLYRAHYSHVGLAYKGKSTSAIYGYPAILKSIIWKLKPKKIYVVWDGAKSKNRMELLPQYKRRDKPRLGFDFEDFQRQEGVVRKMLQYLGIPQVYHPEMEADDLICGLTQRYKKRIVYIVSSDKDFDQLLGPRIRIWNDKENRLTTWKSCKKQKGYTPEQCVDYLSLLGDKSDNIPGYRGMGEKRIIKFLEEHNSIIDFLYKPEAIFKGLDKKQLGELYAINLIMIDLRYHWVKNYKDVDLKSLFIRPKYSIESFKKLCKKYSLLSFKKHIFVTEFKKQYFRSNTNRKLRNYEKQNNVKN